MKKSTIFFFSAIICILGSIGFFAANAIAKSPAGNRAKDKSLIRKNFPVSTDFDAVKLEGVADIVYSESASAAGRSVYAMVPKCMLPYLKITNRDGRLVISTANDNKHESINCKVRATVYITGGSLRDIELEGVGNFSVKGTLHASSEGLDIDLEGVAAFSAPIIRAANSKIKVDAEGVGNIDLGDVTCRLLDISSQGTSNLTASRLKASTLDIEAEGTGMIRLFHRLARRQSLVCRVYQQRHRQHRGPWSRCRKRLRHCLRHRQHLLQRGPSLQIMRFPRQDQEHSISHRS